MTTIRIRRNTAADAAASNPILAEGELGLETDTGKIKGGDGTTAWNDLPYAGGSGGSGIVETIVAGTNVTVDDTDPANPIVSATGGGLPSQTGNAGKILRTDATTAAWTDLGLVIADAPAKPSPVGGDKFVMSDSDDSDVAKRISFTDLAAAIGGGGGSGDVVGPASAVDDRIATFDGVTGKLIQDGGSTVAGVLDRANHTGTQSADTLTDGTTNKAYTAAEQSKLAAITGTNTGDQTLPTLSSLGAVPTSRTLAGLDLSADLTASALRTALGLVIGTDVLAPNGSGASLTGIPESAVTNLVTDLAAKAPLASPTFTGTPAAPTAAAGTATTQVATTGFAVAASMFRPTAKIAPAYYAPVGMTAGGVTSPFSAAGVLGAAPIYLWAGSYIEVGNSFYYGTGTATIRIGLYDSTGTAGLAGSLVSGGDFGTISCVAGSSGSKSISISLTLATSGWYWIAGLCDAFTSAPQFSGYRTTDCSGPTMVPGFPHSGDTNRPSCILRTGVTTGSMPSTFGTPTNYQGTNFPAFRIYLIP